MKDTYLILCGYFLFFFELDYLVVWKIIITFVVSNKKQVKPLIIKTSYEYNKRE